MSVLNTQHGGNHYQGGTIQPIQYIHSNNLNFFEGNTVKYVTRHKKKNGAQDIEKAIHYLQMILEFDYGIKSTFSKEDEQTTVLVEVPQITKHSGISTLEEIELLKLRNMGQNPHLPKHPFIVS